MKENAFEKNKNGLFILLSVFFFVRIALFSPVQCFLMNPSYPYFRFSVESVVYIILLLVFSVLSAHLAFSFRNKAGDIAAFVYIVAMADPLFCAPQDNVFKLFVNIVIELFVLNAISEKKCVPIKTFFPVVLLILTFFVPDSVFGYVPGLVNIYLFADEKSGKENKFKPEVLIGLICAASGYLLNKLLVSKVAVFSEFYNSFGFTEFNQVHKQIKLALALAPVAVFAPLFFSQYKKTVKKLHKKNSQKGIHTERIMDAFFYPVAISAIAMFFADGAGFCAINLVLPAIVLVLLCNKDEICIKIMDDAICAIKKHKLISVLIFIAIFAVAFEGVINYHSTMQMIFHIRY